LNVFAQLGYHFTPCFAPNDAYKYINVIYWFRFRAGFNALVEKPQPPHIESSLAFCDYDPVLPIGL